MEKDKKFLNVTLENTEVKVDRQKLDYETQLKDSRYRVQQLEDAR